MANQKDDITCPYCKKAFTFRKNLYKHLRIIHNRIGDKDPSPKTHRRGLCNECGQVFGNLERHLKKGHTTRKHTRRIQCPYCSEKLFNHNLFRDHLTKEHKIELIKEEHLFCSEQDFTEWKDSAELENSSRYVLDSSPRVLSGLKIKKYYNCHRSFEYRSSGGKVNLGKKRVTSYKIGTVCPSRIEVAISNGCYVVDFWKTHVGHSADVVRRFIRKDIRNEIASKLKQGLSFEQILFEFRQSAPEIQLTRKDLHNIKRFVTSDQIKQELEDESSQVSSHSQMEQSACELIKNKTELITDLCTNASKLNEDELNLVMTHFDKIINILSKNSVSYKNEEEVDNQMEQKKTEQRKHRSRRDRKFEHVEEEIGQIENQDLIYMEDEEIKEETPMLDTNLVRIQNLKSGLNCKTHMKFEIDETIDLDNLTLIETLNSNENVIEQKYLTSPKKICISKNQLRLLTPIEIKNIKDDILLSTGKIAQIQTTDHTYDRNL